MSKKLTSAQTHHAKRSHHDPQLRPPHHTTEHKLVRHELHQARVDQDARADTVKHPFHDQSRLRTRRERLPDSQAHGHRHRRRQSVPQCEQVRGPSFRFRPGRHGQSGPETEAFEGLVEHQDDVEGVELLTGDREGEADEDGVEYHAEFEDAYGRHLRGVVFYFVGRSLEFGVDGWFLGGGVVWVVVVVDVVAGMGEVVFAWGMFLAVRKGADAADLEGGVAVLAFLFVFVMGVSERGECGEAHGHQLDEEEDKDGHECYAFGPVVVCYGTLEARVCEGIVGGSKEMDERSGYYDAGAEIFGNEERPFRNSHASMATRVDWKCGTCSCQ